MGSMLNAFQRPAPRVDFAAIKAASSRSIPSLVQRLLPQGSRRGHEWVSTNPTRNDRTPGSFSVNMQTGAWADFATGDRGGDMIDLAAYLRGLSSVEAAHLVGEMLGVPPAAAGGVIVALNSGRRVSRVLPPNDVARDPGQFPARTPPDKDGKPRFVVAGDEGPRRWSDEDRRHVYRIGSTPVRIKIIRRDKGNRAVNWYRVSDGDVTGWQSRKPDGFQEVPFIGGIDPFDTERQAEQVFWPEGEKDAETVGAKGLLAFTFGGCGDGLPAGCEQYLAGRHVVILADNDDDGRRHADRKAALAAPVAQSVKIVHFHELADKSDVTDWMSHGGSAELLQARAAQAPLYQPTVEVPAPAPAAIGFGPVRATPYAWTPPETIPRREFVYGRHLIRRFVSATVAPGGVGKTSLVTTDALAMASGKDLIGTQPRSRSKVWLWNLEDPYEEVQRHIQATAMHFGLSRHDLEGQMFIDSGRDQRLVTAVTDRQQTTIVSPVIDSLVAEIQARKIDVLIIDPFVSSHMVPENDNNGMDQVIKEWGRVADRTNCAVELVHHTRKPTGNETEITMDSARGGKALMDGCRSVRVVNRMSEAEATEAGIENRRRYFRTYIDKSTLAPPAESSDWFYLESVDLGNGPAGLSDNIGVVVSWKWPDLMADVTVNDLRAVQDAISRGSYRASVQANNWVGNVVAEVCRLDLPADAAKVKKMLKVWLASGALKTVDGKDEAGRRRPIIVVGEWAT